jgi:L-threonylcarbamoyladenylate synthase
VNEDSLARAVEILRRGGLVAFATETVYGLGADARNSAAIRKVFEVKGRPVTNPLIVHVADAWVARRYVTDWPLTAGRLAERFWPGPLTLVLHKTAAIVSEVTAGLGTVAIRSPDHPLALAMLREFDGPVAAPSANRSSRVSPTTADHVQQELGGKVDLILDGGPCRVGIESTVLDLTRDHPTVLRPGGIGIPALTLLIGRVDVHGGSDESGPSASPGRQAVHYSPTAAAFRFGPGDLSRVERFFQHGLGRRAVVLIIAHTDVAEHLRKCISLDALVEMPSSADGYARKFYAALHEADAGGAAVIWIQEPPSTVEWQAVRDRIYRATRAASESV